MKHSENCYYVIDYWEHRDEWFSPVKSGHIRRRTNHQLDGNVIVHVQVQGGIGARRGQGFTLRSGRHLKIFSIDGRIEIFQTNSSTKGLYFWQREKN